MRSSVNPEFRSPDLTQYKLADEHEIRCPKCRAGSNCIASNWQRGQIALKCICGWTWELFIDSSRKVAKTGAQEAPEDKAEPVALPKEDTIIKRCRTCRGLFEIPRGAKGLYCGSCRKEQGLPPRSYDQTGDTLCPT